MERFQTIQKDFQSAYIAHACLPNKIQYKHQHLLTDGKSLCANAHFQKENLQICCRNRKKGVNHTEGKFDFHTQAFTVVLRQVCFMNGGSKQQCVAGSHPRPG